MDYITGYNGFLGKNLGRKLTTFSSIPHTQIQKLTLTPFDRFFFLSSYGNLWQQEDIDEIIKANIFDLIHVLKQVNQFSIKSFVYISTSSVKLEVQTPYSRSKKAAEEILLAYMEKYKLPICIIRPLSITGVGEQERHLIPTLIRSCMTGEVVNFYPDATHDFIDIEDVVSGILSLSNKSAHGIFELGTGVLHSNKEVLDIVEKVTGRKANINRVERLRPYDNEKWVSTNFNARRWGWLPKVSLQESIRRMVENYDK